MELPSSHTPETRAKVHEKARGISTQAKTCEDMEDLGKRHGSSLSGSPGKIEVGKLSPLIQRTISGLQKNQASKPVEISGGFLIIMVCERDTPPVLDKKTVFLFQPLPIS